jgi:hypothetical protein
MQPHEHRAGWLSAGLVTVASEVVADDSGP